MPDLYTPDELLLQPLTPAPLVIVDRDAAGRANVIAWTATLLPDSGIDPSTLIALAAREVAVDPSNADYRKAYGAALYRAGKYKEAVEQLTKAVLPRDTDNQRKLFLAMACHQLGYAVASRLWFVQAKLDAKASWEQRLIYQRLRQEAAVLLKVNTKPMR